MARVWGIPRFTLADLVSLWLLMLWPLGIARSGSGDHGTVWVAVCFGIFAVCVGFLWMRGLWILQQFDVHRFSKRTLFLAVLLPAIILFGFVVGEWMFSLLICLAFPHAGFLLAQTVVCGIMGGVVYAIARAGLDYVFGKPAGHGTDSRMDDGTECQ